MKCPWCSNTDPQYIDSNGVDRRAANYTLLCLAPVPEGESVCDDPEHNTVCGNQWEPNNKE